MDEQGAKFLAETLSTDDGSSVHALNLAANPIGDEASSLFCQCFQENLFVVFQLLQANNHVSAGCNRICINAATEQHLDHA